MKVVDLLHFRWEYFHFFWNSSNVLKTTGKRSITHSREHFINIFVRFPPDNLSSYLPKNNNTGIGASASKMLKMYNF